MTENDGQIVGGDTRPGFVDRRLAVFAHDLENVIKVNRMLGFLLVTGDLGIGKKVSQQLAHALRTFGDEFDAGFSFVIELASVALEQQLRIARNHAQRLLQVMAGGEGELIQVLIGAEQRFIGET